VPVCSQSVANALTEQAISKVAIPILPSRPNLGIGGLF